MRHGRVVCALSGSLTIHTVLYGQEMAKARTPRARWIDEGLRALADGGPDAVRIDALAQTLGVTRGGFYWHFADRGALLEELLDTWERRSTEDVLQRVERQGGDPAQRLRRAGALTFSDQLVAVDLAVRDWARRDAAVAARLRRVDNRRMEYLRSLFAALGVAAEEIEARCLLAFSLAIGVHLVAAEHPGPGRAAVLKRAMAVLAG
jgi:AcrR family transcriptional regulator